MTDSASQAEADAIADEQPSSRGQCAEDGCQEPAVAYDADREAATCASCAGVDGDLVGPVRVVGGETLLSSDQPDVPGGLVHVTRRVDGLLQRAREHRNAPASDTDHWEAKIDAFAKVLAVIETEVHGDE